jgi:hypothetical protein
MWAFKRSDPDSNNSKSRLDDFFDDQDKVTSLVREAIQNSLDAPLIPDTKVIVKFRLVSIPWENFEPYTITENKGKITDHFNAKAWTHLAKDIEGKPVRTLLVEDYNTKGLTGSFDKDEEETDSNLVNFWWQDGFGNKGIKGSNGSAGIGKICFIAASKISTMWGLSKRVDESIPKILLGNITGPYHHVEKQSYLGYARYADFYTDPETDERKVDPITNESQVKKFEDCFGAKRDETGLTVIVPAIVDDFSSETILHAVMKDYFWAIINNKLEVQIFNDDGEEKTISSKTIDSQLDQELTKNETSHTLKTLKSRINFAREIKRINESGVQNKFSGIVPHKENGKRLNYLFNKECVSTDNLELMYKLFDEGQIICLEFSLEFMDKRKNKDTTGLVQLYTQKMDKNFTAPKEFIRRSILLTSEASAISNRLPNYIASFLYISDEDMSDYVVSAEDPAHIKLTLAKFKKNGFYSPDSALRFIKRLSEDVYKVLSRSDDTSDIVENFDEDIFSIDLPDDENNPKQKKKNEKKDRTKNPDTPKLEKPIQVIAKENLKDNDGFKVQSLSSIHDFISNGDIKLPLIVEIKAAYESIKGRKGSWTDYSKNDFDFNEDIEISIEPIDSATLISVENNNLRIEANSADFSVTLKGFDKNRDLLTKTKVNL